MFASIDLKSFYASVECMERGLDPLDTNLVVADESRTTKTICLAVSPSLKAYGLSGRSRLFQVVSKIRSVNLERRKKLATHRFVGKSFIDSELKQNSALEVDYIVAPPRMKLYMKYSTDIYKVYLKYVAPEDIYAYSIDEVFIDISKYLKLYKKTPQEFVSQMILDVYKTTGITATAGIGTNMYLCKVAMDILAKHTVPNSLGVRIAFLDEKSYRSKLWNHRPLTDFWRVGPGYAKKLESIHLFTMGDIARCSLENEALLFRMFGVNAELLIDHSWGFESVKIEDIKKYKPESRSICSGQVLSYPYTYEQTKLVIEEMSESIALELTKKQLLTDLLLLHIDYDKELDGYRGPVATDRYGRTVPKPAHGTFRLQSQSSSTSLIKLGFVQLFDKIIRRDLKIKKINMTVGNLCNSAYNRNRVYEQMDLFTNYETLEKQKEVQKKELIKEQKIQQTLLNIKNKYGKNAIFKGMNLLDDATALERNETVGGHKG